MSKFASALRALVILSIGFCVSPAAAVNPSLSGSITLHFAFHPDDPGTTDVNESFWYFDSWSGGIALTVPILDITTVGAGNFNWNNPSAWTTFPLNTSGLGISHTGSGSYTAIVNNGQANLNVLGSSGPSEGTVQTNVAFPFVHNGPSFSVFSNVATTRYNVTLPTGAHLNDNQIPTLQNLTINSGASVNQGGFTRTIRQNLTNHGSGEFNDTVVGNFINDAVAGSGNVANAVHLEIGGQLVNTGELYIPQYLETESATSNAGSIFLNGGGFYPQAAFANNGTFEFSGGSLNGPGVVTNNGAFDWSGGNVNSSVVNTANSFTISGNSGRSLQGTLTNSGTITVVGGGTFTLGGAGILTNQADGLFDIIDNSQMYDGAAVGTINNAGTFRKSGGGGVTIVGPAINNTGTITVTSGSLKFLQGGTFNGGTMSFANGGTVDLNNGSFFFQGSHSASGDGALVISGGGARGIVANGNSVSFENFTGGADLLLYGGLLRTDAGGSLALNLTGTSAVKLGGASGTSGGHIGGAGTTTNFGNLEWTLGSIEGNFTNNSASFTTSGNDTKYISGGNLSNASTITHSGDGGVYINQGGTLVNQAGALYDITGDGGITAGAITDTVTNAGTFRKSGGSGTSVITAPLTNTGTLAIESGTMLFAGPDALVLDESGTLAFKLSGNDEAIDFGKVHVTHELALDGALAISLEPGFEPSAGDTFNILDWGSLTGTFDLFSLPVLGAELVWDTTQLYVTGELSVFDGIPGDYNRDGFVNTADYIVWRKTLGSARLLNADGNNNGHVGGADFFVWQAHFGEMVDSGSGGSASHEAVPEPISATLLLVGLLAFASSCRAVRKP